MAVVRPDPELKDRIVRRMQALGAAALAFDVEDSHSGNITVKWIDSSGAEQMAITATGSQKGDLRDSDICFPALDKTNYGHYKASSETDIHARILALPGVGGSMHGHTKNAIVESLDDNPKPPKQPLRPLRPVDPLGCHVLGTLAVEWFAVPSGSPDMARRIPDGLRDRVAVMVHGHGPFCRGRTTEEAFYHLALVEYVGTVRWFLRLYGVDPEAAADLLLADSAKHFPVPPAEYSNEGDGVCDFPDEPDTAAEFLKTGRRIFINKYSPFHSGSLSLRGSDTLLYAPKASMPDNIPGPLLERPLAENAADNTELAMHKRIYAHSNFQAVCHIYCAEAEAAALAAMPEFNVEAVAGGKGKYIVPIDAEGSFLHLKVPLLQPDADFDSLLRALHDYRLVIVRGRGVWTVGEQSLSEVLHHASSARDICYFRAGAARRNLRFDNLEPEKARNW